MRIAKLADENGVHAVFYGSEFLRAKFRNVINILIDATFACVSRMGECYQLLPILGIKFNHVSIFISIQ